MADTLYCYPNSDVLINKLGIKDQEKLHTFERKLTMLRLLELLDKPIKGRQWEESKRIYPFFGIEKWVCNYVCQYP